MPKITKAVFPVAGLGTRFLPATKSIPKEMLPLINKPLVQYAVDEARAAGIEDFIFISARGKSAMADYFDKYPALEERLERAEKTELLDRLRASNIPSGSIAYVRQGAPNGLGHAVACARKFIGRDESFAVVLPDDVIKSETPCLKQMIEAWQDVGGSMVGMMKVPRQDVSAYGIIDPGPQTGAVMQAKGLVEKPDPDHAPSGLAVIGRYILSPEILVRLEGQSAGHGGEIQLTDAIHAQAQTAQTVYGFEFEGTRFDCGSLAGFIKATIEFSLEHPKTRDAITNYMRTHSINQSSGE